TAAAARCQRKPNGGQDLPLDGAVAALVSEWLSSAVGTKAFRNRDAGKRFLGSTRVPADFPPSAHGGPETHAHRQEDDAAWPTIPFPSPWSPTRTTSTTGPRSPSARTF